MTDWRPGMSMWFGKSWGAPVNESCNEASVPVGQPCHWCPKSIGADSQGFLMINATSAQYEPVHRSCMMEITLGPQWRDLLSTSLVAEIDG